MVISPSTVTVPIRDRIWYNRAVGVDREPEGEDHMDGS